ncbi:hypothetical protein [Streptomyces sp. MBT62]|uniref:hypothetical protein n=1 Tax=Streptomyces sp. MBT62 TaxID=2800410 RepID=UPI00190DB384|nr:hypothetical protein [Streptomyces sp. MBT62]MBK3571236.1 hypothetical protein [Streptomyces sp. MBT62]
MAGDPATHHALILDGYQEGLRAAGVHGPALREVGRWYDLAISLRWGVTQFFWARHLTDARRLRVLEERWWRRPYGRAAPELARLDAFLDDLASPWTGVR